MSVYVSTLLIASSLLGIVVLDNPRVVPKDLQPLTGAEWKGSLFYLDYQKNKMVSIPSNLIVTQSAEDKTSWVFEYRYPDEPKANNKATVSLTDDGKVLDGKQVIERKNLSGDRLKIVTEKSGSDNDRKALLHFTYLIAKTSFSVKKEVRYNDTKTFFVRNEYRWIR